ncbi:MAG: MHS family MFS transporter [Polyangiaceae bacterium]|nr:MHS family MFS transporter [Polyangiaceae bacterium]NUQ72265.1 MHS family MFS transporter [Polyangiaceae bacterium]
MTITTDTATNPKNPEDEYSIWSVIGAATAGTVIEWYDFYIFGSLATIISGHFFPKENPTAGFLATLATFATGFIVRPFGALIFGRIGDLVGRKYAFLVTLLLMGGGTAAIGLVPSYESIGIAAPLILLILRLLQGLALGGEYGGAAVYVAEHAPDHKRGFYTSFIQITATAGFFISLGVVLAVRLAMGEAAFNATGWRIPFLLSILLVAVSIYIRLKLKESPLFTKLKRSGKSSSAPLRDSLGSGKNWGLMLLALFGATAGQGVVWYTGQFYALYFLQKTLGIDLITSTLVISGALVAGAPFFVIFGALSDKIGRKKIMLAGNLLAVLTYVPIYMGMKAFSDPVNPFMLGVFVFLQVLYVTMVYGPIAAFLVELFPGKIRYTSMSLPYHVGNGVFGGLTPLIGTAIVDRTGNIYAGLYYPMGVAAITFVVGAIFLKETNHISIWSEVGAHPAAGDR